MRKLKLLAAALAMTTGLTACSSAATPASSQDEIDRIETVASYIVHKADMRIKALTSGEDAAYKDGYLDFSFNLLGKCIDKEGENANVMISPASVMLALDMTAAGSRDNTLGQIMSLYGGEQDPDGQFSYAAALMERMNDSDDSRGVKIHTANSMWVNSALMPGDMQDDYSQFVREFFDAETESLIFDSAAQDKINGWVNSKTDGMIPTVVDQLDPAMALMLINAVSFEGEWSDQYTDANVSEMDFTSSDGSTGKVNMLCKSEKTYVENDLATGFIKYYKGGEYAFVVMLPKDESQNASQLMKSFTGRDFAQLMSSATKDYDVVTRMPEFSYDYKVNMNDTLKSLGMVDAFEPGVANFEGMADLAGGDGLYVGSVDHKTHIEVNRNGTRAAAVTVVSMYKNAIDINSKDVKQVFCDRPFAYAIVDMTTQTPIFIGTVNSVPSV